MSQIPAIVKSQIQGGKNEPNSCNQNRVVSTLLDQRTAPSQYLGEDAPTSIISGTTS